jgi:hypothetical protein
MNAEPVRILRVRFLVAHGRYRLTLSQIKTILTGVSHKFMVVVFSRSIQRRDP